MMSGKALSQVFQDWAANYSANARVADTRLTRLISFSAAAGKKDLNLLGVARNKYLDVLEEANFKDVDYLIALDTDMCAVVVCAHQQLCSQARTSNPDPDAQVLSMECGGSCADHQCNSTLRRH